MLIEKTVGYRVGDSIVCSLEEAQKAALLAIVQANATDREQAVDVILNKRDEVLAILSMKGPKVRKPRADKGRPRKTKGESLMAKIKYVPGAPIGDTSKESKVEGSGNTPDDEAIHQQL